MPRFEGDPRPLPGARYAILASRWNPRITEALVDGARRALDSHGVPEAAVDVVRVPISRKEIILRRILIAGHSSPSELLGRFSPETAFFYFNFFCYIL